MKPTIFEITAKCHENELIFDIQPLEVKETRTYYVLESGRRIKKTNLGKINGQLNINFTSTVYNCLSEAIEIENCKNNVRSKFKEEFRRLKINFHQYENLCKNITF